MALSEFGQKVQDGVIAESVWLLAHEVSLGHNVVYCPWGGQTSEHLKEIGYKNSELVAYCYRLSDSVEARALFWPRQAELESLFLGVLESAGDLLRPEMMTMLLARYAGMKL